MRQPKGAFSTKKMKTNKKRTLIEQNFETFKKKNLSNMDSAGTYLRYLFNSLSA